MSKKGKLPRKKGLSVCSVTFGRSRWTHRLVENLIRLSNRNPNYINEIIIVDNNRDGWIAEQLGSINSLVTVIQHTRDEGQFSYYGHDHAAGIVAGLNYCSSERKLLLDCDAHPIKPTFFDYVDDMLAHYDAVVAHDIRDVQLSHPCFMLFGENCDIESLIFDSGPTHGKDVGRIILTQLRSAGLRVRVAESKRAFGGVWGDVWDKHIYHHGHGTFRFSDRHRGMQHRYACFFEQQVLSKHRYELSLGSKLWLTIHSRLPFSKRPKFAK